MFSKQFLKHEEMGRDLLTSGRYQGSPYKMHLPSVSPPQGRKEGLPPSFLPQGGKTKGREFWREGQRVLVMGWRVEEEQKFVKWEWIDEERGGELKSGGGDINGRQSI